MDTGAAEVRTLEGHTTTRWHAGPAVTVECVSGRLWLTEPGGADVLLEAGQSFVAERAGLVVIEALGTRATFRARRGRRATVRAWWQRIRTLFAAWP